uniref:Podocin n=1 Tax=Sinocyclocheilus grahami TaxID=75366 RepID=A0A672PA70_SINGR
MSRNRVEPAANEESDTKVILQSGLPGFLKILIYIYIYIYIYTYSDNFDAIETNLLSDGDQSRSSGFCGYLLTFFSFLVVFLTFPVSVWFCMKIVQEYERAVIFRLGRLLGGAKGPGLFWIIPCVDTFRKVDLRTVSFDIPPQEVLTKDSVTIMVDAVVYYRIFNPTVSITKVENANHATQMLAQTTLRNMLGTKSLADILKDREEMSEQMEVR